MKAKRSYANYLLPYKAMNWSKPKTSVINRDAFSKLVGTSDASGVAKDPEDLAKEVEALKVQADAEKQEEQDAKDDVYRFRTGRIPPYRYFYLILHGMMRVLGFFPKKS